jgi:hypothetical protein
MLHGSVLSEFPIHLAAGDPIDASYVCLADGHDCHRRRRTMPAVLDSVGLSFLVEIG